MGLINWVTLLFSALVVESSFCWLESARFLIGRSLQWGRVLVGIFLMAGDLICVFLVVGVLTRIFQMAGVFVGVFIGAGTLGRGFLREVFDGMTLVS